MQVISFFPLQESMAPGRILEIENQNKHLIFNPQGGKLKKQDKTKKHPKQLTPEFGVLK